MAQQVKVILVDDIDGGEAVETLSFSLDGTAYEIDLNETNADRFRAAVAAYVGAARKSGRTRSNGHRVPRRPASGERGGRAADIRQ
ncbi:MAG: Lsr2 family protein, partial [Gaiellales bacterium]